MKKKIIIGIPKTFDMHKCIIKNLEYYNFEVIDISFNEHGFKIKNYKDKIIHGFRKVILKDYDYKSQQKIKPYEKEIINKINLINGQADYALIIRSDIYPISIIKLIKEKSKKIVGYQWDGLDRFPGIYNHIPFYDKFFVFDEKDKNYPNVSLTNNFYFDFNKSETSEIKQDFFFFGSFIKSRMTKIESLLNVLDNIQMTYKVVLVSKENLELDNKKIIIKNQFISYEDYLIELKASSICLDFLNEKHSGLSLRVFEALHFNKKLITNNLTIKNYDFYNSNNIFIWNENDEDLKKFLNKKYQIIDQSIKKKYSFGSWIENILK